MESIWANLRDKFSNRSISRFLLINRYSSMLSQFKNVDQDSSNVSRKGLIVNFRLLSPVIAYINFIAWYE